ncbi:CehA/McbA family metallohydrolase [Hymenobacter sp. GOD-10R]|uniref:CehA/McbA family metallohydrolase n=1 Tax=Hymenobacter sp. GOD-10R TaxID=3093922 RepID=UPI002D778EFE|nr:CehA/McbA family metallohydrolase [Hymenobacter sp. GOD-10R]WRQ26602.1 CehA/McbA family metallohydrolase [Hymenobacter sp. GOD-10R]
MRVTKRFLLLLGVLSFALAHLATAQSVTSISKKGHIPADSLFKLVYVPIDVPTGIAELRVKEIYSQQGKNVLNLGIYGPEGYQMGNTAGFRGWSGGAKTEFFLNAQEASTGYIPGKIKPGRWHILIYPSTILPEGIDWELAVSLVPGPDKPAFQLMPAPASVNNQPGWYRGDLHMHTLHSDGKRTPQELVNEAVAQGLDFIVSTEHNTNSANLSWGKYAPKNLLIINGEEVTTTAFGHWNAMGLSPTTLIEWRYTSQDKAVTKYLAQVHADSGLAIINHAFYTKECINGFGFDVKDFDGIEVWNGQWDALDELALKWWDDLLRAGTAKLAVADSDTHTAAPSPNQLGRPQTVVKAKSLSRSGIMQGLRKGNAYLSADNKLRLTLTATAGAATANLGDRLPAVVGKKVQVAFTLQQIPAQAVVTLHGEKGVLFTEQAAIGKAATWHWTVPAGATKYVRVEVRTPQGEMLALTNPIWLG